MDNDYGLTFLSRTLKYSSRIFLDLRLTSSSDNLASEDWAAGTSADLGARFNFLRSSDFSKALQ